MKFCFRCQTSKAPSEFNKNPSRKDGLQTYCAECYKIVKRDYYARHKDRILEEWAAKYRADPEKFATRTANYYQRNSDNISQRHAAWRKVNKPIQSAHRSARRARERDADGSHTAADIKTLLELQKHRCACCRISVRKKFHVDHVKSLAKGGSNKRDNLQILCPSCNMSKSTKDPLSFMRSRGFLL